MQKNFTSGLQVKAVQAWELIRWCSLIERCLQLWYNCPTYGIFTFSFINPRLGVCRGSLGPSCDPLTFSCAVCWLISAAVNMCGIGIGICYTTVFLENRNCHASSECISRAHSLASFKSLWFGNKGKELAKLLLASLPFRLMCLSMPNHCPIW